MGKGEKSRDKGPEGVDFRGVRVIAGMGAMAVEGMRG